MSKHHTANQWQKISPGVRAKLKAALPAPCGRCGRTIEVGQRFVAGHVHDLAVHGQVDSYQHEHPSCSSRSGGKLGRALQLKRNTEARGGFHHDL